MRLGVYSVLVLACFAAAPSAHALVTVYAGMEQGNDYYCLEAGADTPGLVGPSDRCSSTPESETLSFLSASGFAAGFVVAGTGVCAFIDPDDPSSSGVAIDCVPDALCRFVEGVDCDSSRLLSMVVLA